jgi:hypothetical protein
MDAGHYISRDRKPTRWNEKNCDVQCPRCNRFRSGEQFAHGRYIDKRYGNGTAEMLETISRAHMKLTPMFLGVEINIFREKVKKLKQGKGL